MADFVKLNATATRLIAANGRQIKIVKFGNAPEDESKPWRGRREYLAAEVTTIGAFVPMGDLQKSIARDVAGALRETEFCLVAADSTWGYDLRDFDAIEDDGRTWKIISVELISPASVDVIYQIEVTI